MKRHDKVNSLKSVGALDSRLGSRRLGDVKRFRCVLSVISLNCVVYP
jgi:hypothetical protein